MYQSEVARLFAYICVFDNRVVPDDAKIWGWHEALYPEIDFEFAKNVVTTHYATKETAITPSVINNSWGKKSKDQAERDRTRAYLEEMEGRKKESVPAPYYVEELRQALNKKNKETLEKVMRERFGDAVDGAK